MHNKISELWKFEIDPISRADLLTKTWKMVLVCKIHKNDEIKLKLYQKVDFIILYKCV